MLKRVEDGRWNDVYNWYWGAASRWPEVFQPDVMRQLQISAETLYPEDFEAFIQGLRTALFRQLYQATQACNQCELSRNRLPKLPVLDDGDLEDDFFGSTLPPRVPIGSTTARIMVVGEGPGEYEQRTGVPLVSYQTLLGSRCARGCAHFEACYRPKGPGREFDRSESKPARPCQPERASDELQKANSKLIQLYPTLRDASPESRLPELRRARAARTYWDPGTCGNLIDVLLYEKVPWAWRSSWNPRYRALDMQRTTRDATLYVTNAVKCRAVDTQGENRTPTYAELDRCRDFLEMQIYILQPQVIVALGKPAYYALTRTPGEKVKITADNYWGPVLESPYGIPVLLSPHPSWALRQDRETLERWKTRFVQLLERARAIAEGDDSWQVPAAEPPAAPESNLEPESVPETPVARPLAREADVPDPEEDPLAKYRNPAASSPPQASAPDAPRSEARRPAPPDAGRTDEVPPPEPPPAPRTAAPVAEAPVAPPQQAAAKDPILELQPRVPGQPENDPRLNPLAMEDRPTFPESYAGPREPEEELAVA